MFVNGRGQSQGRTRVEGTEWVALRNTRAPPLPCRQTVGLQADREKTFEQSIA